MHNLKQCNWNYIKVAKKQQAKILKEKSRS